MEVFLPDSNIPPELCAGEVIPVELLARWLKSVGRGVKVYVGCKLTPPGVISLGDFTQIDEGVRIYAGQEVVIGQHVHLAFGSSISGGGECVIDDFVGIGAGARLITGTEIVDGEALTNSTVPLQFRGVRRGKIRIGAHAVVFTNSVVFPDVEIGEGAVVAAGSAVHRSLKPWTIYAGNPLVPVGQRKRETILRLARELIDFKRNDI